VRYLTLAEAMVVAEAVTGIPAQTLTHVSRVELLDWPCTHRRPASAMRSSTPGSCVAPIPASSGKTTGKHRLNRSGDRAANAALYRIALCRLRHDPATRAYVARRTAAGKSKKDIIRCLKRYIAREVYAAIHADLNPQSALDTP